MYRKHLYLISLIFQCFLVILMSISFGYSLGKHGDNIRISDFISAYVYLGILILFTVYQYRSPYHEMKSAIYLSIYYFAPAILIGLFLLMEPSSSISNTSVVDSILQVTYLITGFIHLVTIVGKQK